MDFERSGERKRAAARRSIAPCAALGFAPVGFAGCAAVGVYGRLLGDELVGIVILLVPLARPVDPDTRAAAVLITAAQIDAQAAKAGGLRFAAVIGAALRPGERATSISAFLATAEHTNTFDLH
jgi:hypothetical protein